MEEKLRYLHHYPEADLKLLQEQAKIEEDSYNYGLERYNKALKSKSFSDTKAGFSIIHKNFTPYMEAIRKFIHSTSWVGRNVDLRIHLRELKLENLAFVAMKTILNAAVSRTVWYSLATFCRRIAQAVKDQYAIEMFRKQEPKLLANLEANFNQSERHALKVVKSACMRHNIPINLNFTTDDSQVRLGMELFVLLQESTGLVWTKTITVGHRSTTLICVHPEVTQWISQVNRDLAEEEPLEMPMIIPPLPWSDLYDGGFLSNIIRKSNPLVKVSYNKKLASFPPLPKVCSAVNKLQLVKWRINRTIYNLVREFSNGGNFLDVGIPTDEDLPLPPQPWPKDSEPSKEELRVWKKKARDTYEQNAQIKQSRVVFLRKLFLAGKFIDYPEIYFCWTLDWRGRAYPVQTFINPQGDDLSKALIEFSEGKPVTPEGFYWMRVHGANCYGVDKVSFDDRVEWVNIHSVKIKTCAIDPFKTTFWRDAEDPLQFLAFCYEYHRYTQDPTYLSHMPVYMDGSCNGLQHLSAMLKDPIGGASVNLTPTDKPADVYSDVLKECIALVEADAKAGNSSALLWQGKLDRKMVKRGVMTTPYGVTNYGLADQIEIEMLKRSRNYLGDPKEARGKHATYLSKVLVKAMQKVLVKACEVMDYLRYLAGSLADVGIDMQWVTPAGFYVQQDYINFSHGAIHIRVLNKSIKLKMRRPEITLSKPRQQQGIVPNFVHSMDAAHMMNTILAMPKDTSLAMIHDSYGTHCSDIPQLHYILRKEFIKIYNEDPLAYLHRICETRSGLKLKPPPEAGSLDLELVNSSKYFFS